MEATTSTTKVDKRTFVPPTSHLLHRFIVAFCLAETGDNAGPLVIKGQKKEDWGGAGLQASVKAHEEELLKGLKEVPLSEVAKHNTDGDMWIVVHGRVVDVSKFVEEHPGGVDILKQFKGKVADDKFDSFHTPNIVDENIDKLAIVVNIHQPPNTNQPRIINHGRRITTSCSQPLISLLLFSCTGPPARQRNGWFH